MSDIMTATWQKVRQYLKEIHGEMYDDVVQEVDDTFVVRRGSATVNLTVKPLSDDDCIVQALAYVVQGVNVTPSLLENLMRQNVKYPFGAFGLMFDNTITFSHRIAGAHLDKNELRTTIGTVGYVADEIDVEIREALANAPQRKPAPKKNAPAKQVPPKKAMKPMPKKAAAKKAPAKKSAPKKAAPKKAMVKKATAKKASPKKVVKKKVALKKPVKKGGKKK